MATYRLWPATNGPSTAIVNAGNFISGTLFAISGGGTWFEGYWWWVAPTGQSTAAVKCALWSVQSSSTGTVVPGSVVTSGTLTAGAWNYIPLPTPIQLAPGYDANNSVNGSVYIAAIGVNGNFPDTTNYWGAGQVAPGGITNGPLHAYSGISGTHPSPYSLPQGIFSTAGSDPSITMPLQTSGTDNFWVDVQVSDQGPAGYTGTYRLWPSKADANNFTSPDSAVNYVIATEIDISQTVQLSKVWYYSLPGATQLATWVGIFQPTSADTGTLVASNAAPSWSGAAGSGWISTTISGTLGPGTYKVAIYNGAGVPAAGWGPTDSGTAYWDLGVGANGITWGPLTAPKLSLGYPAYNFADAGNTNGYPPTGAQVAHAQPTFSQPMAGLTQPFYPYLWAGVLTGAAHSQNYWIDLEVTQLTFTINLAEYAGVVDHSSYMTVLDKLTVFSLTSVTSLNSSFASTVTVGKPVQYGMRQLANAAWNYMYPG